MFILSKHMIDWSVEGTSNPDSRGMDTGSADCQTYHRVGRGAVGVARESRRDWGGREGQGRHVLLRESGGDLGSRERDTGIARKG